MIISCILLSCGIWNIKAVPSFSLSAESSVSFKNSSVVNLLEISSGVEQQKQITGTVTDEKGNPVAGVTVIVKGTTLGNLTDASGKYILNNVPNGSTLVFSFVGMVTQEIPTQDRALIDVVLKEAAIGLADVVVVGFGTARKENLTGAISNIKSTDIVTITTPSLAQALSGKIAGLDIRQNSGQPGQFDQDINIRGFGAPLYVIDGIPRGDGTDFQKLDPQDIESISVLKDASAAIYGMNANNGVVIVTTKKGVSGKTKFSFKSVVGIQSPTNYPIECDAYQYETLFNAGEINAGRAPLLTKDELAKYQNGTYPSTNWYDATFKNYAMLQNHTFTAEGGNDAVTYFSSFGYENDGGLLKSNDLSYEKYTFRSNITAKFTKNLVAQVNIDGLLDETRQPSTGFPFIWQTAVQINLPTDPVYANNNPLYLGNPSNGSYNSIAQTTTGIGGYGRYKNKNYGSSFSLTWTVPFIKGLQIKGLGSYISGGAINKNLGLEYNVYNYDPSSNTYLPTLINHPSTIENDNTDNNTLLLQAHLIYNTTIADAHHIGATLVYEQRRNWSRYSALSRQYDFYTNDQINQASLTNETNNGYESQGAGLSYIGRFTYDYKSKYLAEFAFRDDGSYRYAPNHRFGFFPVISAGWRLSEENFIKDNVPVISNLKLRASYGLVGADAGNPFQYLIAYSTSGGNGYEFTNGTYTTGVASPAVVNPNLTWITNKTTDIGIEFGLFKNKLTGEFDVYQRERDGLLATRAVSIPNTFGQSLPQENLNSDRTRGLDFSLGYNNTIGKVHFSVKGNFNFARTENLHVEHAPYTSQMDKWLNGMEDRYTDYTKGFNMLGQFQSWNAVSQSPPQKDNGLQGYYPTWRIGYANDKIGSYKYEDFNHDGVIDASDMQQLFWNNVPKIFYGFNLSVSWDGFDFNALFQGAAMYNMQIQAMYADLFWGNPAAYYLDRWHQADPYNPNSPWIPGKFPPSDQDWESGAMYNPSQAWIYNASYLRLKNVELGYTFSPAVIKKAGFDNIRLYANTTNVFTICNKFVKQFDPERNPGTGGTPNQEQQYPLMRSFNLGININF